MLSIYWMTDGNVGETIVVTVPYSYELNQQCLNTHCSACCKQGAQLKRCAKCKIVQYCDAVSVLPFICSDQSNIPRVIPASLLLTEMPKKRLEHP